MAFGGLCTSPSQLRTDPPKYTNLGLNCNTFPELRGNEWSFAECGSGDACGRLTVGINEESAKRLRQQRPRRVLNKLLADVVTALHSLYQREPVTRLRY